MVSGPVRGPDQKSRSCRSFALRAADIVAWRAWPIERVRPLGADFVESEEVGVCGLDNQSLRRRVDVSSSETALA